MARHDNRFSSRIDLGISRKHKVDQASPVFQFEEHPKEYRCQERVSARQEYEDF